MDLDGDKASQGLIVEQLNLFSVVLQQKAISALAQEQMQIIELEERLIQAEAGRSKWRPDRLSSQADST